MPRGHRRAARMTARSGRNVARRIRPRSKTIDDLARTCETQLLAHEAFERAVVGAQTVDALAELPVLVEQKRDATVELVLLRRERPQVQESATAKDHDR